MIVLPAIGAIVAAVTPIVEAALIAAGIGAVVGGAACGIGGVASGIHEHGALNQEIAEKSAHRAAECAVEGAVIGGATGAIGIVVAPVVAPAITVVDDVARPVIQVLDDASKPVVSAVDDALRPTVHSVDDAARPAIQVVDDAAQSTRSATKAVFKANALPWNNALNSFRASIYKRLPIAKVGADDGYVYVMRDIVSGNSKIGRTINPAQRLKGVQSKVGHKQVNFTCIIHSHDFKKLEKLMHNTFASQRLPNTGAGTEWFDLSSDLVAKACSY